MSGEQRDRDKQLKSAVEGMRRAQPYIDAVWMLIGGVGAGVLVGYELDKHFRTSPWLLIAGSALGIAVGFYGFFKSILRLGKRS